MHLNQLESGWVWRYREYELRPRKMCQAEKWGLRKEKKHIQGGWCADLPCDPRCTPGCLGRWLVSRRRGGIIGDFLDGGLYRRFSRDSECSPTGSGGCFLVLAFFGWLSAIEAETFGMPPLSFSFRQLSICIEDITELLFQLVGILGRWLGHSCCLGLWGC